LRTSWRRTLAGHLTSACGPLRMPALLRSARSRGEFLSRSPGDRSMLTHPDGAVVPDPKWSRNPGIQPCACCLGPRQDRVTPKCPSKFRAVSVRFPCKHGYDSLFRRNRQRTPPGRVPPLTRNSYCPQPSGRAKRSPGSRPSPSRWSWSPGAHAGEENVGTRGQGFGMLVSLTAARRLLPLVAVQASTTCPPDGRLGH
jgi:hypothetical protein